MTYNNGVSGRHRNGDKRRPVHGRGPESDGGNRTSLLTPPTADPWMDTPDQDWPGGQSRSQPGSYSYPAAPNGGGASYREPAAAQYQGPRQHTAPVREPVRPSRPRPGNGGQYSGPMPPYGHPSGPIPQYDPPSPPASAYNQPSGPMRQVV